MANMIPYRYRHLTARPSAFYTDDFFRPFFQAIDRQSENFRIDVRDEGDHYLLEADLPGVDKNNISIEIDNNVLTIAASVEEEKKEEKENYIYNERRSGSFQRSFTLKDIREDAIDAKYENGVLKLNLPKKADTSGSARRIELN